MVDSKLLARVAAIAFAAVAITLAVIEMREPPATRPDAPAAAAQPDPVDPLRRELRRCQAIGAEAASDRGCLRAWAENRRRFLAPGARPMERRDPPGVDGKMDADTAAGEPVADDPFLTEQTPTDKVID